MTPKTQVDSWVYFIREILPDGTSGQIKIGKAKDPWGRRDDFQTANSNELILEHIEPGSYDREAYFHRRFKRHRGRGEWFDPAPEIEKYLTDAPDHLPAPSSFSLLEWNMFGWLVVIPRGAWRILLALILSVVGKRRRRREVRPLALLGLAAPATGAALTITDITDDPTIVIWATAAVLTIACTIAGTVRTR